MTNKDKKLVEITRSFSYKLNLGNYQTADFFCSQKVECFEEEAEIKSEAIFHYCRSEVLKSVNIFKKENLSVYTKDKSKIENKVENKVEKKDERKYDAEMDVGSVEVLQEINN